MASRSWMSDTWNRTRSSEILSERMAMSFKVKVLRYHRVRWTWSCYSELQFNDDDGNPWMYYFRSGFKLIPTHWLVQPMRERGSVWNPLAVFAIVLAWFYCIRRKTHDREKDSLRKNPKRTETSKSTRPLLNDTIEEQPLDDVKDKRSISPQLTSSVHEPSENTVW